MNCELFLNNKKIDFYLEYIFKKEGKYKLKIIFKKLLKNTSFMFSQCSSLTSLNLSNFNTFKVNNMRRCYLIIPLYFI
jgi:surface protein